MVKLDNITELSTDVPPTVAIPEATLSADPQTFGEKPRRSSDEDIVAANRFAVSHTLLESNPPPEIAEVKIVRVADLITANLSLQQSLIEMGASFALADYLASMVYFADTGILTLTHSDEQGGARAPILEPNKLRILSRQMLFDLLQQVPGANSIIYHCSGPTGFLYKPTSTSNGSRPDVGAYEGLLKSRFTNFGGHRNSESSNVMSTFPGSGRVFAKRISSRSPLPAAVLANIVKSPMAMRPEEGHEQEPNPNALLVAIKGRNITPSTITSIAREAGHGALGIFLVADGELESSAIHSLPNDTIEPSDLGDYMDIVTADGQFVGAGTASIVDPYSRNGHIHTDLGHFRKLNEGTLWALVYPAQELYVQYQ